MKRTKYYCKKCGKPLTGKYQIKFCSNSCASSYNRKGRRHSDVSKKKISTNRKGITGRDNHPRWKGGQFVNDGYKYILKPSHPNAIESGYILEHRLVMEKYLGRYLNESEIVHHNNGNS